MPIEKIKRTQKSVKRKVTEKVTPSPELEKKREAFKKAVAHRTKSSTPKSHTGRKRTLIISVAAILVALGSTLVAFAYHWYDGPEATVMQSMMNAAKAPSATFTGRVGILGTQPSSFDGSYQPGKSIINATIKTPLPGMLSTLKLSLLNANQNTYVKLDHASELAVQTAAPDQQDLYKRIIPSFASRIDDKWISMSQDEIGSFKSSTGISQCMVDIIQNFTSDSSSRQGLVALYTKHPFMDITTTNSTDDKTGMYRLQLQSNIFDSFMTDLYSSQFFASLAGCSKQNDGMKAADMKGFYIDLTINKSDRIIKEVHIYTGDATLTNIFLSPVFGQTTTINEPTDAFQLDTIKTSIMKQLLSPVS